MSGMKKNAMLTFAKVAAISAIAWSLTGCASPYPQQSKGQEQGFMIAMWSQDETIDTKDPAALAAGYQACTVGQKFKNQKPDELRESVKKELLAQAGDDEKAKAIAQAAAEVSFDYICPELIGKEKK